MQVNSKRKAIAAAAAMTVCLLQACGGTDPVSPEPEPTPDEPILTLTVPDAPGSVESVSVDTGGGAIRLTVKTNQTWTATTDVDWLEANPSRGDAGTVSVTLTAEANPTDRERIGVMTIKATTLSVRFTVVQPGREPVGIGTIDGDLGDWGDGGDSNFNKQN